jgi:hypothetical protein
MPHVYRYVPTDKAAPELRNQIYALVMIKENATTDFEKLVRFPREKYPPQVCGHRGLTQVSRQVRQEFLPLYRTRNVYIEIGFRDIHRYVDTFYDLQDHQALAKVSGSIEISLDRDTLSFHGYTPTEVDILPLLQVLALAPHLHARFIATSYICATGMPPFVHDLGTLLRTPKTTRKKSKHHLLHSFKEMTITIPSPGPSPGIPELVVWPMCEEMQDNHAMVTRLLRETGIAHLQALMIASGFIRDEEEVIILISRVDTLID